MVENARKERPQSVTRKFMQTVQPNGQELRLGDDEIIVSKTDTKGVITYANSVFLRLAGMTEAEAIGAPHSVIRHPDMPRGVFKFLWDRIQAGREVFAYVVNLAKTGEHYWVLAHVTPTYDASGKIVGYHSNRRAPRRAAVETMAGLYAELNSIESQAGGKLDAAEASLAALQTKLDQLGTSYDAFIFSLEG